MFKRMGCQLHLFLRVIRSLYIYYDLLLFFRVEAMILYGSQQVQQNWNSAALPREIESSQESLSYQMSTGNRLG